MIAGWARTLGRAVTLARVGRAARAVRQADSEGARRLARARLADLLGGSRGIAMKVGQLAASEDTADPMSSLLTGVAPVPLATMRGHVEDALGGPVQGFFSDLLESEAAASLGQVHQGILLDGTMVAMKVRYPDIKAAVQAELALAGLLPGVGPVRKWGFDLTGYKRVLGENMTGELNYIDESARQEEFASLVRVDGLVVPRVHSGLCRETVLVQSWEHGDRLEEARQWPKRDRLELGRILLETLFSSLFRTGLVHADPHPGNYRARKGGEKERAKLVLMDYGCTVRVPAEARLSLLHLIVRTREGGVMDALAGFAAMGFAPEKLEPLQGAFNALCPALFRPFVQDGPFQTTTWRLGEAFDLACGDLKWWFRSAGPPELLLLMRAFQGVCQHLSTLDVALPWWALLERVAGPELLDQARRYSPPPLPQSSPGQIIPRAALLKVRVRDETGERASVAMPAREAMRLETVIPEDVAARITGKGIDLARIQSDLIARGLPPGEVFSDSEGGVEWRVWLE